MLAEQPEQPQTPTSPTLGPHRPPRGSVSRGSTPTPSRTASTPPLLWFEEDSGASSSNLTPGPGRHGRSPEARHPRTPLAAFRPPPPSADEHHTRHGVNARGMWSVEQRQVRGELEPVVWHRPVSHGEVGRKAISWGDRESLSPPAPVTGPYKPLSESHNGSTHLKFPTPRFGDIFSPIVALWVVPQIPDPHKLRTPHLPDLTHACVTSWPNTLHPTP